MNAMTRFRWTIKRKLLTLGAGTFLVALVLLAFGLWSQIRERSRIELDRTSEEVATRISGTLDLVRSTLLTLAQVQGVQDLDREETERLIVDMLRVIPFLQGIGVIKADGQFLSTGSAGPPEKTGAAEPPRTVADRAWFQQLIWSGEPVVSGLLKGRLTGQHVILVAVPIRRGTSRPHAVVAATLNLNRWFAFFSGLSLPPNMRVIVADADGIVLAQNQGTRPLVGQPLGAAFERPGLVEWDGQRLLMEAALVSGVSWRVLALFPQAALYARAWQEIKAVFLPMLIILGASALFGLLIARRVWRPLQALTYGVREFGEGRSLAVPVTSTDEVGELAQAFNEMTQRIHQSQASLERRAKRLAAVIASATAVSGSLKLEEVLAKALDAALKVMGMETGVIRLLDNASGELVLAASRGALFRLADTPQRIKVGDGFSGHVAATKQPFFVPDTTREPRTAMFVKTFGPGSAVSLPLLVHDRVVGTMSLFNRQPNDFDKEDAETLTAIGKQVGLAVETSRLYASAQSQAQELASLHEVGTTLASTLDLRTVLESIADSACTLVGAKLCVVYELGPDGQHFDPRATRGMPLEAAPRLRLGQGAVGNAALSRKPIFSPDIREQSPPAYDQRVEGTELTVREFAERIGFRGILAVPLISKGALLGVLGIYWEEVHSYSEREVSLLTAVAQQAAVAIDNARLYAAAQQHASRVQALYEIGKTISSSLDLNLVLQQIAEQAMEVIGSGRCVVYELNEADQRLYVRAKQGVSPDQYFPTIKVGQGAMGSCVVTKQPVFSPDLSTHPLPGLDEAAEEHGVSLKEVIRAWGVRSILSVPLLARERPVGAISILWDEPHPFREEEVETLTAFASQAALAMSNARLHEETVKDRAILEQSHRTLEAIHRLSVAIQESMTLRERLNQILAGAQELLGVERIGIYLSDPDGSHLKVMAGLDPGHPIGEISIPTTEEGGALAKVFREGCEVWLDPGQAVPADMRLGPRYRDIPFLRTRGFGLFPLKARGKVVGVMAVDNKATARAIPRESVPLLRIFAQQTAVAIENARLVENLQATLDELKVAQEQLVRGETLRSLGEMAAGAAHHLNNLLAVVVARIQLLLRKAPDPQLQHSLEIVERAALDGAEVVRRVQRFARVRPREEPVPVDLNQIAEEALEFTRLRWQNEARARGVEIDACLLPGQIPFISGQAAELREVVTNLVLNAVDALPNGGKIVLRSWAEDKSVLLSISDNGIGMSKEAKRQAFEPFFTTKGVKSTGLGLSVVHGIVESHGGAVALESEEGHGTVVTLRFPALPSPTSRRAPKAGQAARAARLLAIDDEPEVLDVLKELLASLGHVVTTASKGEDGLALLERERYDLVLTDLAMPGMTGWQVAQAVKSRWPDLPVVLLTGWADQVHPSLTCVDRLLKKPFQLGEVEEALAALLPAK